MHIFVDDERVPSNVTWIEIPKRPNGSWVVVRSYEQFVRLLKETDHIDHISFDHDLADKHYVGDYSDERTGFHCAKALIDWCMDNERSLPSWTVHSMNPVGQENINMLLLNYKRVSEK